MHLKKLTLIVGICVLSVAAADKWFEAPFQEWGEKDVQRMLTKSPWAKSYTFEPQSNTGGSSGRGGGGATGVSRGSTQTVEARVANTSAQQSNRVAPAVYLRAQWYSAKPVRMALARQVQLLNPAADMSRINQFVDTDPEDAILMLRMDFNASGQGQARMISMFLARQTLETMGPVTVLTTKSKKRIPLKMYVPPTQEDPTAKFIFPRTLPDGQPLIEEDDKEASFRTQLKLRDRALHLHYRFKTKDMIYQGKFLY